MVTRNKTPCRTPTSLCSHLLWPQATGEGFLWPLEVSELGLTWTTALTAWPPSQMACWESTPSAQTMFYSKKFTFLTFGGFTHRGAAGDGDTLFGPTLDTAFDTSTEGAVHRWPHVSFLQGSNGMRASQHFPTSSSFSYSFFLSVLVWVYSCVFLLFFSFFLYLYFYQIILPLFSFLYYIFSYFLYISLFSFPSIHHPTFCPTSLHSHVNSFIFPLILSFLNIFYPSIYSFLIF